MLTRVVVRDLPLLADVGINPDEVGRRQPLVITVEVQLDTRRVSAINDTVDYRKIANAAEELAKIHIPLIETFAQRLGEQCLDFAGAKRVRVCIDKPFAITRGMAGVEVEVSRGSIPRAGRNDL